MRFSQRLHCTLLPILTQYTTGVVLYWKPEVNNGGGSATLNVDSLRAKPVKLADGVTDPGPLDLVAG